MVNIEPFKFQKANNIDEHNQLASKLNECVEVFNDADLESIPDLITKVDDIDSDLGNVESDVNSLKTTVTQHTNVIAELDGDVTSLQSQMTEASEAIETLNTNLGAEVNARADAINAEMIARQNADTAEATARENADITAIAMGRNGGNITTTLNRALGNLVATVDCPFISTATLIPTSTERAFKIQFTFTDGTQYDTNEFVIPEGGGSGTDVTVSAVTVGAGTAENSFKVTIQLSDGSTIASNDYVINIPESVNTYPTAISGTVQGTGESMALDITLNNDTHVNGTIDLGLLATVNELSEYETQEDAEAKYATKTELATKANQSAVDAIGITSDGVNELTVNGKSVNAVNTCTITSTAKNSILVTTNGVATGFLNNLPIGGEYLGAVKNGGNVTINSDGTMNAQSSGVTITEISSIPDDLTSADMLMLSHKSPTGSYANGTVILQLFDTAKEYGTLLDMSFNANSSEVNANVITSVETVANLKSASSTNFMTVSYINITRGLITGTSTTGKNTLFNYYRVFLIRPN